MGLTMHTVYSEGETIEILRQLADSGHSMRCNQVQDNRLLYAVKRHFGTWRNMLSELEIPQAERKPTKPGARSPGRSVKWTKDVIYDTLTPMIDAGMTPKQIITENKPLYAAVVRNYGNIRNFCNSYGLKITRERKYTQRDLDGFIRKVAETYDNYTSNWLRNLGTVEDRQMCDAATKYYGTWNKALTENGFTPVRTRRKKIGGKSELVAIYTEDVKAGLSRGDIRYRDSINKYFGSIDALDEYIGNTPKTEPVVEFTLYSRRIIDEKLTLILRECSEEYINVKYLNSKDINLVYSMRKHKSSVMSYFSEMDIDFYTKPYVPFKWTSDNVKRQLLRWVHEGYSVNYSAIAQKHGGILEAARKIFGGWKQLFDACGLEYEEYRVDTDMASYYGHKFELIVGEVFTEIGMMYTKYNVEASCHPDFVVGSHWYDAKLSQWTISNSNSDTIKKYEPHCESLTIVFLRGDVNLDKKLSDKTRIVNISHYISKLTPAKARYYTQKLLEIESELSSIAA